MADFLPTQSNRGLTVELNINGEQIDIARYFTGLTNNWGNDKDAVVVIELFDEEWETIEELLFVGVPITLSYGWTGSKLIVYDLSMITYSPTFSHSGVNLSIRCSNSKSIGSLDSAVKNLSWGEASPLWVNGKGIRPSDIVQEITDTLNISTRSQKGVSLIEKSKYVNEVFHTENKTLITFIRDNVLKNAFPESGKGEYRFGVNEKGNVYFGTNDYFAKDKGVVASYIFAKDQNSDVISFAPEDMSAFVQKLGGKSVEAGSTDPRTKTINKIKLADDNRAGFEEVPKSSFDGTRSFPANSVSNEKNSKSKNAPNRVINKPFRTKEQLENYIKQRYYKYSQANYKAELEVLGNTIFSVSDLVRVNLLKKDNNLHYLSGVYTILSWEDKIDKANFVTSLELQKATAIRGAITLHASLVSNPIQNIINNDGENAEDLLDKILKEGKAVVGNAKNPGVIEQIINTFTS